MKLEEMAAFFEARLPDYDQHMLSDIESAREFYPFTADCLPGTKDARVLDLGCGTGLELEFYFRRNPSAAITGIDLSTHMLAALQAKFSDKAIRLIRGSYFDVPLGEDCYDAAVSVESLHHFNQEEKTSLYTKVRKALVTGGYFILTDYFADTPEQEAFFRSELLRLKAEQDLADDAFYHYDTPLTVQHETEALLAAGFSRVEVLSRWGATHTIKAM